MQWDTQDGSSTNQRSSCGIHPFCSVRLPVGGLPACVRAEEKEVDLAMLRRSMPVAHTVCLRAMGCKRERNVAGVRPTWWLLPPRGISGPAEATPARSGVQAARWVRSNRPKRRVTYTAMIPTMGNNQAAISARSNSTICGTSIGGGVQKAYEPTIRSYYRY